MRRNLSSRLLIAFAFVILLSLGLSGAGTLFLLRDQQRDAAEERVGRLAEPLTLAVALLEQRGVDPTEIQAVLRGYAGSFDVRALLVNDHEVGDELPRQMAHRPWRHLDPVAARPFDGDLLALAARHEALKPDVDENVVGDPGPWSHDARQLRRANEGQLGMSRTVALPFPGDELAVGRRAHCASLGQLDAERVAALRASGVAPGKGEPRQRGELS